MNPIPDLSDAVAMQERGQKAALWSSRREANEQLRDAYTALQAAPWAELRLLADKAIEAAERIKTLAAMESSL